MSGKFAKYNTCLFGMSLARMGIDATSAIDFLDSTTLNAIELPYECFINRDPNLKGRLQIQKYGTVICGGVMDEMLTSRIPFAPENQRMQYIAAFRKNLLELGKKHVTCVQLNFDMQSVLTDVKAYTNALEIIRMLLPVLTEFNTTFFLNGRLPMLNQITGGCSLLAKFLRDTMNPRIKLALELNLPDIHENADLNSLFGALSWELKQLVFSYNADSGYHLSIEQMRTVLDFLAYYHFCGPVLIAPKSSYNRMAIAEFDYFCKMIRQLRNE